MLLYSIAFYIHLMGRNSPVNNNGCVESISNLRNYSICNVLYL